MVTRVTVCSFGGAFGCFRPPVAPVSGLGSERKCIINGVASTESLNFPIRQLFQVNSLGSCEWFSVKTRAFYSAKMVMHEPDHQLTVMLIVVMREEKTCPTRCWGRPSRPLATSTPGSGKSTNPSSSPPRTTCQFQWRHWFLWRKANAQD